MDLENLELPLERDLFFRSIIRALSGTLEDTVGLNEASGYIALVGNEIGEWILQQYRATKGKERLTPEEVAEILVDLKRRIDGDFYIVSVSDKEIVLGNNRCPFGDLVKDRPSLCQMTTNVFGRIAADINGYSRVELPQTIAKGDGCCRAVVHLIEESDEDQQGREFFALSESTIEESTV